MKKFKNKNTGEVVTSIDSKFYEANSEAIPKRFIEDSCDWEEVKEQTFQIISFSYAELWGEGFYAKFDGGEYYITTKGDVITSFEGTKARPAVVIKVLRDGSSMFIPITSTENIHLRLRIEEDLLKKLEKLAGKNALSISAQVRMLIKHATDNG